MWECANKWDKEYVLKLQKNKSGKRLGAPKLECIRWFKIWIYTAESGNIYNNIVDIFGKYWWINWWVSFMRSTISSNSLSILYVCSI